MRPCDLPDGMEPLGFESAGSKAKMFLPVNVYEAAKERIHHIFDVFDSVVVSFSGGKDSLAVLHLVREVSLERGISTVNANFYDEELIPGSVLEFVDSYRRLPWVNLTWLAIPLHSQKYVLGSTSSYVQWDPRREHYRPKPEWAITQEDLGLPENTVTTQNSVETLLGERYPGRVAIVNGIRASESIYRLRGSINKLVENYINKGDTPKTSFCKPIFDWEQNDVFRYFYDKGIKYAPSYDAQLFAGQPLRVSTPLHAETAKRFHLLAQVDPTLYDQVVDVFPEMLLQERYGRDLRRDSLEEEYGQSWDTLFQYVKDHISDKRQAALARTRLRSVKSRHLKFPEAYPLEYIARQLINGAYKREIFPLGKAAQGKYIKKGLEK